jgi:Major Facilitator Superfamily.
MMTLVPLADWFLHSGRDGLYILLPLVASAGALLFAPFIPILATGAGGPGEARSRSPFYDLPELVRLPVFLPALLSFFLFCLTDATAAFMANMTSHYGLMASYFLSSNALVGVAVRIFCARQLDRYPRWALSAPSILITAGTAFLASFEPTQTSLIVLGLVFGVGMGFGFPLHLALVSDGVPGKLQPQAVSLSWFLMGLDFALVPMLLGWMGMLWGPVTAFRVLCLFALGGALLSGVWWLRVKRGGRR